MGKIEIKVDGIPLDKIMSHYNAIGILITHAQDHTFAGSQALMDWDTERAKPCDYAVKITATGTTTAVMNGKEDNEL